MYEEVWPAILDAIADGASLKSALLSVSGAPSYTTAKRHLREDADLRDEYRSACQDRADRLAEEILTLADEPMPEHLEGKERGAWVQQQRLRVDTRKWMAAKLYPKMYGERLDVNTIETRISITAALAEAEQRIVAGQLLDQSVGLAEGPNPKIYRN
jgi:hypothetical protein